MNETQTGGPGAAGARNFNSTLSSADNITQLAAMGGSDEMNFLPGWCAGATSVGGFTLSEQASATSTAQTITVPSGVQSGDLLVLLDRAANTMSAPSTIIPSGFTSIVNTLLAIARQIASYKIADGTEGGTNLTGMSGNFLLDKALYVFRGSAAITSVSVSTPNAEGTSVDPASQAVSASGGTAPLIVFGCYSAGLSVVIDPRTFSPAKDGEITPDSNLYLAYKIYNAGPADVTIDMENEGSPNILQSFYIECSE